MAPKRSERVAWKRNQIRAGALRVFLAAGFSGSSMDQVAQAAGVSKQTLYVYYRSKDELLVDVFSNLLDSAEENVPDLWSRSPKSKQELRDSLVDVAHELVTHIMTEEYLALIRVLVSEMVAVPELTKLWRRAGPMELMERVGRLLQRAQEAGVVREIDRELATRMVVGPLMSYVLLDGLARPGNVNVPQRSRLEALIDLYLEVVT